MSINNNANEIAILSIEIGNNQMKYLKIYNNSIPSKIAYDFCLEYNLDYESLKKLTFEIKNLISESNKKQKLNKSYEKSNKIDNFIQIRKNKSVNISPIKVVKIKKEIKKYNFKDIAKEIQKPLDYDFKLKTEDKEKLIYNQKYKEKINNVDINNNNKLSKENKKEINAHYLSQTESSKTKIKNKKLKEYKPFESEGKNYKIDNIKLINNNNNLEIENNKVKSDRNKYEINFGEKLYEKCMKMKKISNEKIKNEFDMEQKKLLSECTFKPKIHEINIKCFKNININNNTKFIKIEKKKIEENSKNKKIENETINHRKIKNNITTKNKKIKKKIKSESQIPIFERLYNCQKKEEEKSNNELLFKPKINNNYKKKLNKITFNERQKIYSAKSTERRKKLENQIYNKYDNKTGQKLFHPLINKNKNFNKNRIRKYYSFSLDKKNIEIKKEKIKKEILTQIKKETIFKPNMKSDNIFENVIINSFKKIFNILDEKLKGKISLFNYSTKNLPINIKNILAPIFNQIDLKNKYFNEEKFINECKKLFKNLDYYSKREIYKFSEEEKENNEKIGLYSSSSLKSRIETNNDILFKTLSKFSTSENNKENIENNKTQIINDNIKFDINDYYINGKHSKIYERFYNNKTFYREKTSKLYENLIMQRDDIIL